MPIAPTQRMRTLAARWLTDTITLQSQTVTAPTRAEMASGALTLGAARRVKACVRQASVSLVDGVTVRRDQRELTVWVDDTALPVAGERVNFVACSDATLNGNHGTVESVDRDDIRAVRRMLVRLGNDG